MGCVTHAFVELTLWNLTRPDTYTVQSVRRGPLGLVYGSETTDSRVWRTSACIRGICITEKET